MVIESIQIFITSKEGDNVFEWITNNAFKLRTIIHAYKQIALNDRQV